MNNIRCILVIICVWGLTLIIRTFRSASETFNFCYCKLSINYLLYIIFTTAVIINIIIIYIVNINIIFGCFRQRCFYKCTTKELIIYVGERIVLLLLILFIIIFIWKVLVLFIIKINVVY